MACMKQSVCLLTTTLMNHAEMPIQFCLNYRVFVGDKLHTEAKFTVHRSPKINSTEIQNTGLALDSLAYDTPLGKLFS